jgi:hypothetical protein
VNSDSRLVLAEGAAELGLRYATGTGVLTVDSLRHDKFSGEDSCRVGGLARKIAMIFAQLEQTPSDGSPQPQ